MQSQNVEQAIQILEDCGHQEELIEVIRSQEDKEK